MISSITLGAEKIDFSEIDFMTLSTPPDPYVIQDNGYVLRCRVSRPCYDKDLQTDFYLFYSVY